jgi:hypothetical protein
VKRDSRTKAAILEDVKTVLIQTPDVTALTIRNDDRDDDEVGVNGND